MVRRNPAIEGFQVRRLTDVTEYLVQGLDRVEGAPTNPSGPTDPGSVMSITQAEDDPDVLVYSSQTLDGSDVIRIPVSSLMVPDPADPDVLTYPKLLR